MMDWWQWVMFGGVVYGIVLAGLAGYLFYQHNKPTGRLGKATIDITLRGGRWSKLEKLRELIHANNQDPGQEGHNG